MSARMSALVAGVGLLGMAVLAPIAHFGVLQTLIVPTDAAATVANITTSEGPFRLAIAAFVVIVALDILVAWGLYAVFRPINEALALLVAWLRVAYAAVLAVAVASLLDVVRLIGADASSLAPEQLEALVMSSIRSFEGTWDIGLAIFGLHLVGLGILVLGSSTWSRILGALVVVAGAGYLVDAFGTILLPDYALTVSLVTFVGEALLIVRLLWVGFRGQTDGEAVTGRQAAAA